jgi:transposase
MLPSSAPTRPPRGRKKKSPLSNAGEPPDHALGRSQGGFGTKVHVVCDGQGQPLGLVLTPGQQHESTVFETAMATVESLPRPAKLAGDKAYRAKRIREWLSGRGIEAVIPTQKNEPRQEDFDRESYRRRNVVERLIGRLKEWRRIATRYEKLAVNFLAMIHLAMIVYYLGR